jgi:hypothetical protein
MDDLECDAVVLMNCSCVFRFMELCYCVICVLCYVAMSNLAC